MTQIRRREIPEPLLGEIRGDLHPVLRRVYAARRIAADEVDTALAKLIPVGELGGAAQAAARLADCIENGESILIVGDFDADGATSTALCVSTLRAFGCAAVDYLVPNRFEFGYGLSPAIVDEAAKRGPALIITVDNGISSIDGVRRARELGIEVLVTDHHLPGAELPDADFIVNPNLAGETFPSKGLCGVGVAFYVLAALSRELAGRGIVDADKARAVVADGLDLVALGTIADLVPLDYNNRILVAEGLRRIRAGRTRPGIRALFQASGRNFTAATGGDLGSRSRPG